MNGPSAPPTRSYVGAWSASGYDVWVETGPGDRRPLESVVPSSIAGWGWGYRSAGSGNLALALLVDALGSAEPARALWPAYEKAVVVHLPQPGWRLQPEEVLAWAESELVEQQARAGEERRRLGDRRRRRR